MPQILKALYVWNGQLKASEAVAIEDTRTNKFAASQCGIECYLYPGEYATLDYNDMIAESFMLEKLDLSEHFKLH